MRDMSIEEAGRARWMALDGAGALPAARSGTTVYISIGNSDDKLSQVEWSKFVVGISAEVVSLATQTHGAWFSHPAVPWQNACWCVEFASEAQEMTAKETAAEIGRRFGQESVAWATAQTEFI
jgi:hypothetical protein